MGLTDILIFSFIALVFRLVFLNHGRQWLIFISNILSIYWLQPTIPIRYLDFWFPTFTLALVLVVWLATNPPEERKARRNLVSLAIIIGLILVIALTRYISYEGILTRSRPPQVYLVAIYLIFLLGVAVLLDRFWRYNRIILPALVFFILLLFIGLKSPTLGQMLSSGLRQIMNQSVTSASAVDLRWLGFSYTAFRLLHVLRDCQNGRLKPVPLKEFVTYATFFPAFVAGPIDRLERFVGDLRKPLERSTEDVGDGGKRLVLGLFKKFVLADTLALIALNGDNAAQLQKSGWGWILLYAYSFQIFLDFSGYTDIAIGLGRILGISLPENFNKPYLQQNLTTFWNNWHMTLTNWFRAYFFNPLTRTLRRNEGLSPTLILIVAQLATMILIGMWHGITWNFLIWGAWHGIGLFVQNRWSDWARPRFAKVTPGTPIQQLLSFANVFLTFQFVTLGWIWFALPEPGVSWRFLMKLFGAG